MSDNCQIFLICVLVSLVFWGVVGVTLLVGSFRRSESSEGVSSPFKPKPIPEVTLEDIVSSPEEYCRYRKFRLAATFYNQETIKTNYGASIIWGWYMWQVTGNPGAGAIWGLAFVDKDYFYFLKDGDIVVPVEFEKRIDNEQERVGDTIVIVGDLNRQRRDGEWFYYIDVWNYEFED